MQTTGKLTGVAKDIETGKLLMTFLVDAGSMDNMDGVLDIDVKKHRARRSLNANSYFHVLVTKIAGAIGATNTEVKNHLIREYGAFEYIEGVIPTIRMKAEYENAMLSSETLHVKPIGREWKDGCEWTRLALMRGSHTYDTTEMSRLIDGTVSEAKELDIETLTPLTLARMKRTWKREE